MFVVTVCAQNRQKLIEELQENNYLQKIGMIIQKNMVCSVEITFKYLMKQI